MTTYGNKKLNIVITAGGTREYIDTVRFISNASSGRMGYAIAAAAVKAGHKVTLITAPTALKPPKGAQVISVITSDDMLKAVKKNFNKCDCLIMAAAVSDYKPAAASKTKIKKQNAVLTLRLKPTTDILAWAGRNKRKGQRLVGFALEDRDLFTNAERKLKRKNLDMIIANTPAAIGTEKSTLHIKTRDKDWMQLKDVSKTLSARRIMQMIAGQ
ncbi:MAG: phosphopantothenoylcysteine decarboxylase [Planctomycetaceae bacterium]|nr:phosphopantothenoylcysteine decarboxylase [Planctomycetaceae bacterium]